MSDVLEAPTRSLAELVRRPTTAPGNGKAHPDKPLGKPAAIALATYLELERDTIRPLLPAGVAPARLLQILAPSLARKPQLRTCSPESLVAAAITCATLRLDPDTPAEHCYLVPRQRDGAWHAEVQIATRGKIELAYRSPRVESIKAVAACENDPVLTINEGTTQTLIHQVDPRVARGSPIGFYAVVKLRDVAIPLYEWVSAEEVDFVRDTYSDAYQTASRQATVARAKIETAKTRKARDEALAELAAANGTPWIANYSEMGRGVAIRRIYKVLPTTTPEMSLAAELDDRAQTGGQNLAEMLSGAAPIIEPDLPAETTAGTDPEPDPNQAAETDPAESTGTDAAVDPAEPAGTVATAPETDALSPDPKLETTAEQADPEDSFGQIE